MTLMKVTRELIECTELFREWFGLIDRDNSGFFEENKILYSAMYLLVGSIQWVVSMGY